MRWSKLTSSFLVSTSLFAWSSNLSAMLVGNDQGTRASATIHPSPEADLLKAHIIVFREHLHEVANALPTYVTTIPSVFLCYSRGGETHTTQVEALARDLTRSGIPFERISLDRWSGRPGAGIDIFEHADRLSHADKVIIVGSPDLKEKYRQRIGVESQEINLLRHRLESSERKEGILPVWFGGTHRKSFPKVLQALPAQSLARDYWTEFFGLLF